MKRSERLELVTDREESLIQGVLKGLPLFEAYRASKYESDGMNNALCTNLAGKVLRKKKNADRLDLLRDRRNRNIGVDSDYVLSRLVEIDRMDVLDIMDDNLAIKPLSEWPEAWRRNIANIDIYEELGAVIDSDGDEKTVRREVVGLIKKLKLPDKLKNLELMGRHVRIGAWKEEKAAQVTIVSDILASLGAGHSLPSAPLVIEHGE